MIVRLTCLTRATLLAAAFIALLAVPARAQKTDSITLVNGDRITCEIKLLDKGRLQVSTDDLGTIYVEWDKVASVTANRTFRVVTSSGLRPHWNRTATRESAPPSATRQPLSAARPPNAGCS